MPTFRPDKQHITMPDGTVFQPACYASDYDWSQHVDAETKAELGEVAPGYDWTQHVSIQERDRVRELCCQQAAADQLAYAVTLGEIMPQENLDFIEACKSHEGTARKYDDAPTPNAKRLRNLFNDAKSANPATYEETLLVASVLADQPKVKKKDVLAIARAKKESNQ